MKAIVDDRGRLFGRINLFDAAVVAALFLLVPVAYAGYLLFRPAAPRITSVEAAPVTYIEDRAAGGSALRGKLKVHGTGLRPVLRAVVGTQEAIAFIFENPTSADVLYGDLAPGTYDLTLYDGVQEVARAARAVTIAPPVPPPSTAVKIVGRLVDLDEHTARSLHVGAKYPPAGPTLAEIVALDDPRPDAREIRSTRGILDLEAKGRWQRMAAVVLSCELTAPFQCRVGDLSISADGASIEVPGSGGTLHLRVDEVLPTQAPTPTDVLVRFLAPAEAVDLIKPGDVDVSAPSIDGRAAVVVSVDRREIVSGTMDVAASADGTMPMATFGAVDRVAAIEARVRLGADAGPAGMRYRLQPLAVGRSILFVTPRYALRGIVRRLTPANADSAQRR